MRPSVEGGEPAKIIAAAVTEEAVGGGGDAT
jgi:hypothetical protein